VTLSHITQAKSKGKFVTELSVVPRTNQTKFPDRSTNIPFVRKTPRRRGMHSVVVPIWPFSVAWLNASMSIPNDECATGLALRTFGDAREVVRWR